VPTFCTTYELPKLDHVFVAPSRNSICTEYELGALPELWLWYCLNEMEPRTPPTESVVKFRLGRFASKCRARIALSPTSSHVVLVSVPEMVIDATGDDIVNAHDVDTPFVQTHSVRFDVQSSAGSASAGTERPAAASTTTTARAATALGNLSVEVTVTAPL
jgi:hypothetical protein